MKINISNLSEGEHYFTFTEEASVFDIETQDFASDVNVYVDLFKTANQIELKIHYKVTLVLICDRCLDEYNFKVDDKFVLIYKYGFREFPSDSSSIKSSLYNDEEKCAPNGKFSDDNLKFITPKTKHIDITEDVRDYILLSVPMRKVPEERDGVCLYCNRRVEDLLKVYESDSDNPVWEKLNKLKKNK